MPLYISHPRRGPPLRHSSAGPITCLGALSTVCKSVPQGVPKVTTHGGQQATIIPSFVPARCAVAAEGGGRGDSLPRRPHQASLRPSGGRWGGLPGRLPPPVQRRAHIQFCGRVPSVIHHLPCRSPGQLCGRLGLLLWPPLRASVLQVLLCFLGAPFSSGPSP